MDALYVVRGMSPTYVSIHHERICTAADQLPDPEIFLVEPLSQDMNNEPLKQDDSQSTSSCSQGVRRGSLCLSRPSRYSRS